MSRYLEIDDEQVGQVASNAGWGDFGDWVESLDKTAFPVIRELWKTGICNDRTILVSELIHAAQEYAPAAADVRSTVRGMIDMLESTPGDVVGVTNGTGEDDD